jgi:hypothetical protein
MTNAFKELLASDSRYKSLLDGNISKEEWLWSLACHGAAGPQACNPIFLASITNQDIFTPARNDQVALISTAFAATGGFFQVPLGEPDVGGANVVYRVIRPDENPDVGLVPKDPTATYSPQAHVSMGSRAWYKGQYVSTTKQWAVAQKWALRSGNHIVAIDLDQVNGRIIDLSTAQAQVAAGLKGWSSAVNATASAEVLIDGSGGGITVPPEAITEMPPP